MMNELTYNTLFTGFLRGRLPFHGCCLPLNQLMGFMWEYFEFFSAGLVGVQPSNDFSAPYVLSCCACCLCQLFLVKRLSANDVLP